MPTEPSPSIPFSADTHLGCAWRHATLRVFFLAIFLAGSLGRIDSVRADIWVTGYYPGYKSTDLATSNIDFSALTHLIHFALVPNSDGSFNQYADGVTPSQSIDLVTRTHAAGKKIIICVGGANSETGFQGATSSNNLTTFIGNLTNFVAAYGYDGVDLDWEALTVADAVQYSNLVVGLRAGLNKLPQTKLLTAAIGSYPAYGDPANSEAILFAALQSNFDQINIMTYDMSGAYPGWVTWFNSPFYNGGLLFPGTSVMAPSIDISVNTFLTNGVAPGKLAIAAAFYGDVWTSGSGGTVPSGGVTLPRQSWSTAPTVTQLSYYNIMTTYYQSNRYHLDSIAQSEYLSVTNGSSNDFISYDGTYTCEAKISYIRNHHLGGLMIWELTQDAYPATTNGQPMPLLQSIKQALSTPGNTSVQLSNSNVSLSFSSIPMSSYAVQWTSNFNGSNWNILTNNLSGTGQTLRVVDTNLQTVPGRLYRVQTPP